MKKIQREVHYGEFLKVLRKEGRPAYLPFYEHISASGFFASRMGRTPETMPPYGSREHWQLYVDFWLGMGWDHIPLEIPPNFKLPEHVEHNNSVGSEALAVIHTMEDFEKYPWPDDEHYIDFEHFETVASLLPSNIKIVAGVSAGIYEWTSFLMGVQGLSIAIMMEPELTSAVFNRIGDGHVAANRRLAQMDSVMALRQGDDLGFKTATFLSPEHLRQYVFPVYARMVKEAHAQNKPYILHSCGNLSAVYDDIIACGFDAKHSYEDVIMPVNEFKQVYGARITPLGGLDVDFICRHTESEIRAYTRRMIDGCFTDGRWALGTGNSLTDYMPVDNYLAVLTEAVESGIG